MTASFFSSIGQKTARESFGSSACRPDCEALLRPPYARAMSLEHFLTFASEAEIAGLWGLGCIGIALIATLAEVRRNKRARIDRIGWMPWRAVFLIAAIVGGGLLMLAAKGLLGGS